MADSEEDDVATANDVMVSTVSPPASTPLTTVVIVGAALSIIIVVTLFGNGLVVGAVVTTRRLRCAANYFVLSLAVTDITVALLVMPFSMVYSVTGRCYKTLLSTRRTYLLIAAIWTCSATISFLPIYLGWFSPHDDGSLCDEVSATCGLQVNAVYAVISSTTSFYAPLVIITVIYVKIFRIARQQAAAIKEQEVVPFVGACAGTDFSVKCKCARKHAKAVKTLGTLMGLFVVSWLPFFLLYVSLPFCRGCAVPTEVITFVTWLGYVNSCFNPGVYAYLNRDFREAFKSILCCCGAAVDNHIVFNMRPVNYKQEL
ncbi:hypothetical protein NP493_1475g00001 [Ridgeia piscesae]|uniref:G-protein coupled receptors family 1 profile domain-containing protein n=1 Tax=Ridgeia piscesae TaxID=27915 RepID=A0AAD9NAT1_RIDPI|nr:hypothetical protein NP493_1475g00001 [Ridgeia piscesae]